jgi:hypothetical protein
MADISMARPAQANVRRSRFTKFSPPVELRPQRLPGSGSWKPPPRLGSLFAECGVWPGLTETHVIPTCLVTISRVAFSERTVGRGFEDSDVLPEYPTRLWLPRGARVNTRNVGPMLVLPSPGHIDMKYFAGAQQAWRIGPVGPEGEL